MNELIKIASSNKIETEYSEEEIEFVIAILRNEINDSGAKLALKTLGVRAIHLNNWVGRVLKYAVATKKVEILIK